MREYSTPAIVDVPPTARLTDVVFDRAEREPGAVMFRRKPAITGDSAGAGGAAVPAWTDVTTRQFRDEVVALAKGLIATGTEPGDRVALMSRTRYEWALADYAIWTAGAVTVPIYETSAAEQVEWILSDSGARVIIVETTAHQAAIAEVLGRLPGVQREWLIEGGGLAGLAAEGTAVTDEEVQRRRTSRGAADLATIIYTSGTTGRPKGCELTGGNLLSEVRNVVGGPLQAMFSIPGGTTLLFLPLAHVLARVIQVGCLEAGVVLGHTADISSLLPDFASFRPMFILAVPRVFEKIYNGAEQRASASPVKSRIFHAAAETAIQWSRAFGSAGPGAGTDRPGAMLRLRHSLFDHLVYAKLRAAAGGRVRYAVSGGAPLGERLGHFFRGAGITILEGYGLTETTAAATVNRPDHNKIGTVGLPLPGVTVRIGDDGEILVKGPPVFSRYWKNEAATAEALAEGGWMRTGDIGDLDEDGYLRVTGRKKELIVTAGGKNVAPANLEDQIRAHPLVSQALVVGDGRPYIACLMTLDGEALSQWAARHGSPSAAPADLAGDPAIRAELQAAVDEANKSVSRAEQIRRFHVLGGDFTEQEGYLTPSLKIRRSVVIKDFAAEIDALYS